MCRTDHHGAPICLCDAGFASRDALGHASCVPYRVLVTGYLVLAVLSLMTLVLLGRNLVEYRHASDGARRSRKAAIRLSVLLPGRYSFPIMYCRRRDPPLCTTVRCCVGRSVRMNQPWVVVFPPKTGESCLSSTEGGLLYIGRPKSCECVLDGV